MRILFRKVPYRESNLKIVRDRVVFDGVFYKKSEKIVVADIKMSGSLPIECDRCGDLYDLRIDEELTLKISDGLLDIEDLDTIECFKSEINFDEIIDSEISSIKSDYHYCQKCKR